jgi:hypothetical protein
MANKLLKIPPQYIPSTIGNLLNCAITSLSGPVGYTQTQPYLVLKHMRVINKDTIAHVISLYIGATGGSAGGTEFGWANFSLAAQSTQDWYGTQRLDSTDFLTGIADLASKVTINLEAEIALS